MPSFSQTSLDKLATCAPDLQTLFHEVIKYWNCSVTEGHRGQADQDKAFAEGKSKLKYPYGNHNATPSNAVDVYPYPIDMSNDPKNLCRFYYFAGFVTGIAQMLLAEGRITHRIRYGGDWNNTKDPRDNQFNDLVHFELC